MLTAHDRNHSAHQAEPIGRSVLIGHLEARHRTLRLLVNGPGIRADEALHLNRLRRRAERWTDLLIGNLGARFDVADLAPNPERAREFSHELLDHAAWDRQGQAWPVALVSIRSAFAELCSDGTSNHDLNAEIAHSIVGSFQPELFDSTGTLRSLWLMRLGAASSDVQGMIEDWLADDRPRRKRLPSSVPPSFERRRHP